MSDSTDSKVFMVPDSNSGTSTAEMMALMNSNNNWNNNPFMYLIWLAFFGGNGFGWGNRNATDNVQMNEVSRLVSTLADNVNTNHNNDLALQAINGNRDALGQLAQTFNTDLASITAAVANVQSAIQTVGGLVGYSSESVKNAIALGDSNIIQQMLSCCCQNKLLVQQMGYESQLRDLANTGLITSEIAAQHSADMLQNANNHAATIARIDQLANGISEGFSATNYATQAQTNTLSRDLQSQTLTIIDKISAMESNAQQDKINTLTAQLTAANSKAERQAELQPIINELNAIKCALPSTTTVQYPQLTTIPTVFYNAMLSGYGYGYGSGTSFWN